MSLLPQILLVQRLDVKSTNAATSSVSLNLNDVHSPTISMRLFQ